MTRCFLLILIFTVFTNFRFADDVNTLLKNKNWIELKFESRIYSLFFKPDFSGYKTLGRDKKPKKVLFTWSHQNNSIIVKYNNQFADDIFIPLDNLNLTREYVCNSVKRQSNNLILTQIIDRSGKVFKLSNKSWDKRKKQFDKYINSLSKLK